MTDEPFKFPIAQVKCEGGIYFPDGSSFLPGDPGYAEAKSKVEASRSEDHIILSSGRGFYANRLIVGIDPQGNVSEGYDGGVETEKFTPAEEIELADLMIARWTDFRRRAAAKK